MNQNLRRNNVVNILNESMIIIIFEKKSIKTRKTMIFFYFFHIFFPNFSYLSIFSEPDIKPVHQYGHNKQQSTTKSMIINANIDQNQDRTTESMNNNNVYDKNLSIRVDDDNDNPDMYDENQKISSTTKLQHLNLW